MTNDRPPSPYKFLGIYGMDDRDLFFGRERETQILLSEVVVGRMVVLFAKTGTGKTSLINAGVRPLLGERGYTTLFVRVSRDPAASLRETIRVERIDVDDTSSLPASLRRVSDQVGQPVVVFFDQFEEFFLYRMKDDRKAARDFIKDVAELYHDRDPRVHIVFSMREDFFVEMDAFRQEIPTIFHNDSNLRLGWFDRSQAEAAIVQPAKVRGVIVESSLVDHIIDDLGPDGLVEPAQLQIVCDTLWRQEFAPPMTIAGYRALGGDDAANVAKQILNRRLEEEFKRVSTREQLELLERLLPALRTERGTKYVRDLDGLLRELDVSEQQLEPVLRRLEHPRLLTRYVRGDLVYVELAHDYLVDRLDDLRIRVGLIWPRGVLRDAMRDHARLGSFPVPSDDLEEVLARVAGEWGGAGEGLVGREALPLDRDEAAFLFRFALHRGVHTVPLFAVAASKGVPVWDELRERLHDDVDTASSAVDLLVELHSEEALALLEAAWENPQIASRAVEALGAVQTGPVVDLLERALRREQLQPYAWQALIDLARYKRDLGVADRAAGVLIRSAYEAFEHGTLTAPAIESLGRVEKPATVEFLKTVLAYEEQESGAQEALLTLSRAPNPSVATQARSILIAHVEDAFQRGTLSKWNLRLLGRIEDLTAVELLEQLAAGSEFADDARRALAGLVRSRDAEVSARAQAALTGMAASVVEPPPRPMREPPRPAPGALPPVVGPLESHYRIVTAQLWRGRVVPFLGLGLSLMGRPMEAGWSGPGGQWLPSGSEVAQYLAYRYDFPIRSEAVDLLRVAEYVRVMVGKASLYDALREIYDRDYLPSDGHHFLASLPGRLRRAGVPGDMLFLTTNFDDTLERAFHQEGEPFDLISYIAHGPNRGRFRLYPAEGPPRVIRSGLKLERSVILKLHGGVDRADPDQDSYVLTEDDYIEYMVHAARSEFLPAALRARLSKSGLLFLGYSMRDWNMRLLLRLIWGGSELVPYKSWAVLLNPDPVDTQTWHERSVEIFDVRLDDYVRGLDQILAANPSP
jgi:hypothetical protein